MARIALPLLSALLLAACGEAQPRQPIPGPEARKAVDAATAAYAECVKAETLKAPADQLPGNVVDKAMAHCSPARTVLAGRVADFHKLGHPQFTNDQLRVVAEASIQQVEPEIKANAVAVYVERTAQKQKAS